MEVSEVEQELACQNDHSNAQQVTTPEPLLTLLLMDVFSTSTSHLQHSFLYSDKCETGFSEILSETKKCLYKTDKITISCTLTNND